MKTWIAAKRGKSNIFTSNQPNCSFHSTVDFAKVHWTKWGYKFTRMMFLIPCNGESPLTTGTCFDYNACILHLQKVKQQNI